MIGPQSFSDPALLDCVLHKGVSVVFFCFFPVRCDSMARVDWSWVFSFSSFSRAAAVRNFPCPGQLGSDNTTAG